MRQALDQRLMERQVGLMWEVMDVDLNYWIY
jgi:hypothetical protein